MLNPQVIRAELNRIDSPLTVEATNGAIALSDGIRKTTIDQPTDFLDHLRKLPTGATVEQIWEAIAQSKSTP